MSEQDGILYWNVEEIARALKISVDEVQAYFTDGRRISFLLERRLAREVMRGDVASSEGAGFDLVDENGRKWEVRSISTDGVYFCPSNMVGSGRAFKEKGFLEKLDGIEGYILSDIEAFPSVPFWIITSRQVLQWWRSGELGTKARITRAKCLKLLKNK